jgi:hypothetical protein
LGVEKIQRIITFSNELQFELLKSLSYSTWKDLFKAISSALIGVDLTFEIAENVKLNS